MAKRENWDNKARFPPNLRTPLFECAKIALEERSSGHVIEENFFAHLQNILPYNKFTLKKLVYKSILPPWYAGLERHRDNMLKLFTEGVKVEGAACGLTEEGENAKDKEIKTKGKPSFLWTQGLRLLLWEIMEKCIEMAAVMSELSFVNPAVYNQKPESEEETLETAFMKVLSCFPEGWVTAEEVTIQHTKLKEKVVAEEKRQQMKDQLKQKGSCPRRTTQRSLSITTPTHSTEQIRSSSMSQEPEVTEIMASRSPEAEVSRLISPTQSPVSTVITTPRGSLRRTSNVSDIEPQHGYINNVDERRGSESVRRDSLQDEYHSYSPSGSSIARFNGLPPVPAPTRQHSPPFQKKSPSDYPAHHSQYLHQLTPFPPSLSLPLPPSPISPLGPNTITSNVESSTKSSIMAVKTMKRINENQYSADSPHSVKYPRGNPTLKPATTTAAKHQAIYESLLRTKQGLLQRPRVDNGLGIDLGGEKAVPTHFQFAERGAPPHTQQRQHMQQPMSFHPHHQRHNAGRQEISGLPQYANRQRDLEQHKEKARAIEKRPIDYNRDGDEYYGVRDKGSHEIYYSQQEQMRHIHEKEIEAQRQQLKSREMYDLQQLEEQEWQMLQLHQQRRLEQLSRNRSHELEARQHQHRVQQSLLTAHPADNPQRPHLMPKLQPKHQDPQPPASVTSHHQQAQHNNQHNNQQSNQRLEAMARSSIRVKQEPESYKPQKDSQQFVIMGEMPQSQAQAQARSESHLHKPMGHRANEDVWKYKRTSGIA
ncbi:hypothetical protein BGX27_008206 [Mortierella sp. AM989]|nr:hypothetical protein BGX27_008206 [Mortierella sp. AM989]